jgi:hypothetical protein
MGNENKSSSATILPLPDAFVAGEIPNFSGNFGHGPQFGFLVPFQLILAINQPANQPLSEVLYIGSSSWNGTDRPALTDSPIIVTRGRSIGGG